MLHNSELDPPVLKLAKVILSNATILADCTPGKPAHGATANGAAAGPSEHSAARGPPPRAVMDAAAALAQAVTEIGAAAAGPENHLKGIANSCHDVAALAVVLEFHIARHVPTAPGSSVTIDSLAHAAGISPRRLASALGLLFLKGVFQEPQPGWVAHTNTSLVLARDTDLGAFLRHCTHEAFPAAAALAPALRRHPDSEEPHQAAFNVAFRTEDPLFKWLQNRPERFANFNAGMRGIAKGREGSEQQMVRIFPWETLGEATVVDIGGGNGHISIALATAFPQLKCLVQDLRGAIEDGRAALPEPLRERVTFQEHDMFDPQPIGHADVYLLRHVLHDWPDAHAARIVARLVPALRPGARVLVADFVVPPPGALNGIHNRIIRYLDMQMMVLHNAHERTEEDWAAVLRRADHRLKVVKLVEVEG
ncbi:S-adenosyl-L-methionine-dependent methyltransferase [Macrophomina phaseolina]|uniref:S-adenosyl-L-methionine-dependent methyltransferase n=1 Tax=Macrophomina phaseolina TaxID=35725 RepID=A0ABQ8FU88_9PEZI|nr:S-adenosyl-L-methionine-dependent methyltransferase [Macrophomina phaseolina]